jgi:twinkle protein
MGGYVQSRGMKSVFITADDPAYLERKVEAKSATVDLNSLDVRAMRREYLRWREDYDTAPFDPLGEQFRLYPGGVTIWSGFPGAGKTTLLRQTVCHLLHRGKGVFVCSLEEKPLHVFQRLSETCLGTTDPSEDGLQLCADLWSEKLRISTDSDYAEHAKLLAVIRVLARDHGVRHAVIDSMMCLDVANDDTEAQRQFANRLCRTAAAAGIHIHLVAHPRKLVSAHQEIDLNDVAGARELGGKVDNVLFVRRSKDESIAASTIVTPMAVCVRKQRYHRGQVGDITGWFHRDQLQFKAEQFDARPIRYLSDDVCVREYGDRAA